MFVTHKNAENANKNVEHLEKNKHTNKKKNPPPWENSLLILPHFL